MIQEIESFFLLAFFGHLLSSRLGELHEQNRRVMNLLNPAGYWVAQLVFYGYIILNGIGWYFTWAFSREFIRIIYFALSKYIGG